METRFSQEYKVHTQQVVLVRKALTHQCNSLKRRNLISTKIRYKRMILEGKMLQHTNKLAQMHFQLVLALELLQIPGMPMTSRQQPTKTIGCQIKNQLATR